MKVENGGRIRVNRKAQIIWIVALAAVVIIVFGGLLFPMLREMILNPAQVGHEHEHQVERGGAPPPADHGHEHEGPPPGADPGGPPGMPPGTDPATMKAVKGTTGQPTDAGEHSGGDGHDHEH